MVDYPHPTVALREASFILERYQFIKALSLEVSAMKLHPLLREERVNESKLQSRQSSYK
jgi:hypothetical protein